jgi:hypothetical protein
VPSLLVLAVWLAGCADVPSTGPTPPEYVAQFRFIHAAGDLGNVGVSVDGAALGNLAFQGFIPHVQFPAGERVAALSNGDTLRIPMGTERRGSVVLLSRVGQARDFIILTERRVFDPIATSKAWVRLVNASPEPSLDVRVIAGADTALARLAMAPRDTTGYYRIDAGSYTVSVIANGDTTSTVLTSAALTALNKRQTSVILGSLIANNLAIVNLADD